MSAPIYGLLLVGGKSSRMGEDKSQLCYHADQPEWQRLIALLESITENSFLCHRADQNFGTATPIIDPGNGPLAAIHSAQQQHQNVAWLVIACDLPLLDSQTLEDLLAQRDPNRIATCYQSTTDRLPEPLCAIYEPAMADTITEAIDNQQFCPRKLLKDAKLITLDKTNALMNTNTKADSLEVEAILNQKLSKKNVTLQYFAQLQEITGKSTEVVSTTAVTPSGLYEQLKAQYGFPHKQKQLMLAVNDDFTQWETVLKEGDDVVFIPPVAGG